MEENQIVIVQEGKTSKLTLILIGIIILLLIGGGYVANTYREKANIAENLNESLNGKLVITKDKLGVETAKRQVIETASAKDFLALKDGLDALTIDLQQVVKDNKKLLKGQGSATIVEGETKVDKSTNTYITYDNDSNAIYKSEFKDDWINYKIMATKDTVLLDYKQTNQFSVVVGSERQGLFKPKKPYVIIKDKNPYNNIVDVRTYQVKAPKDKKLGIGVSTGYSINSNFQIAPFIGVGLNYNIIEIY